MPWLICTPIQVGISFIILVSYLGYAIIPACVVAVINMFIFSRISLIQKRLQRDTQKKKGIRINLISEFLGNIKTSKLYSWIKYNVEKIDEGRDIELVAIRKRRICMSC